MSLSFVLLSSLVASHYCTVDTLCSFYRSGVGMCKTEKENKMDDGMKQVLYKLFLKNQERVFSYLAI
jgi:hypothetical protein